MEYPKLRPVEAFPAENGTICLRDPVGISDKLVFLPVELYFIVTLFDGNHSILDIQAAYTRRFGDLLFSARVNELVDKLDDCLLLESGRFEEAREKALEEYRAAASRPAAHAGHAYERERGALLGQLDGLFGAGGGVSGMDEARAPASKAGGLRPDDGAAPGRLIALIAPHIDPRRGGECYAASYGELARRSTAKTFVVLGISHVQTERRFALTAKDFETPLGLLHADREFIDCLSRRVGTDFTADELVHRSEHSVEFQALFLRYVYPGREEIRIVPILCSSRDEAATGRSPGEDPEFREFAGALGQTLSERGDDACLIARVDLSHLGRRFGQNLVVDPAFLEKAEREDMAMIERIIDRDPGGFFRTIHEERDRRNVCGVPAIYTLLTLIGAGRSRLLKYAQAVDQAAHSVVTFMAAAFYA